MDGLIYVKKLFHHNADYVLFFNFVVQFCNGYLKIFFMETYVLKVYDSRIIEDIQLSLDGIDQVIGALVFVSQYSDHLCLKSVYLSVSESE